MGEPACIDAKKKLTQDYVRKRKRRVFYIFSVLTIISLVYIYPILCKFSLVALTLPVSINADTERGFSCMNRVKTELRNITYCFNIR